MRSATTGLLSLTTAVLLAACSSTPVAPPPAAAPAEAPTPAPSAAAQPAASTVATVSLPDYLDPNNPLSKDRSVFFEFDDFSVKSDYTPLVERHGKYLSSHADVHVKVEGNADERGSAEYNLALGQKRSEAVLRALKVYGARDAQLEAISFGKEKPRATGHDESAWAQNRRADLAYPAK